jgi:hypothetical protein
VLHPVEDFAEAVDWGIVGKEAKAKADKAAKAVKKNTFKRQRKPRFSVVFHRPKTLKKAREPKYPRLRYGSPYSQSYNDAGKQTEWRRVGCGLGSLLQVITKQWQYKL